MSPIIVSENAYTENDEKNKHKHFTLIIAPHTCTTYTIKLYNKYTARDSTQMRIYEDIQTAHCLNIMF